MSGLAETSLVLDWIAWFIPKNIETMVEGGMYQLADPDSFSR